MQVTVWNVPAEKVVFQLPKWTDRYSHVSFSSDGSWPATAGFGSRVDVVLLVSGHSGAERITWESACASDIIFAMSVWN